MILSHNGRKVNAKTQFPRLPHTQRWANQLDAKIFRTLVGLGLVLPATYNKFNAFIENQFISKIDWDVDIFKVMLTNVAPQATNALKAELTEITAGNGYAAGGSVTTITVSRSGGTFKAVGTDVTFTASGGTIGPFRWAVLYDDTVTAPADPLVAWWEYSTSSITLNPGETFTVDFDPTNGIFQAT
jgi:hypothetical protein